MKLSDFPDDMKEELVRARALTMVKLLDRIGEPSWGDFEHAEEDAGLPEATIVSCEGAVVSVHVSELGKEALDGAHALADPLNAVWDFAVFVGARE